MKTKLNTPTLTANSSEVIKQIKKSKVFKTFHAAAKAEVKDTSEDVKKMKVTFKQVGTTKKGEQLFADMNYYTASTEDIFKQAIASFYSRVDKYKRSKSKIFNFSCPFVLIVEDADGKVVNYEELLTNEYKYLAKGLKLQWTKKGALRFSNKMRIAFECVTEDKMRIFETEHDHINF